MLRPVGEFRMLRPQSDPPVFIGLPECLECWIVRGRPILVNGDGAVAADNAADPRSDHVDQLGAVTERSRLNLANEVVELCLLRPLHRAQTIRPAAWGAKGLNRARQGARRSSRGRFGGRYPPRSRSWWQSMQTPSRTRRAACCSRVVARVSHAPHR